MFLKSLLFLLGLIVSSVCLADREGEQVALAQIIHELEALTPLLSEAQAQANPDDRVQFQYDWLLLDIERIKLGIQEHLTAPIQARSVPPLKGDYRR